MSNKIYTHICYSHATYSSAIQELKPADKPYSKPDGLGLILYVQPSGSMWWRFRYRINGTAKMLSFGVYPDVTLAKARVKSDDARALVASGIDPRTHRREQKHKVKLEFLTTFPAVAEEWHAYTIEISRNGTSSV